MTQVSNSSFIICDKQMGIITQQVINHFKLLY